MQYKDRVWLKAWTVFGFNTENLYVTEISTDLSSNTRNHFSVHNLPRVFTKLENIHFLVECNFKAEIDVLELKQDDDWTIFYVEQIQSMVENSSILILRRIRELKGRMLIARRMQTMLLKQSQ